jgi:CheY-like chemotaxis protein
VGAEERQTGEHRKPPRLLVMDDEDCVRAVVTRMLESMGYEAAEATRGEEAVSAWTQAIREGRPFAAAILDMTVPSGMGGLATLAALQAIEPGVKAIASTGYTSPAIVGASPASGFSAVLVKPYSRGDLASVVARVVGGD